MMSPILGTQLRSWNQFTQLVCIEILLVYFLFIFVYFCLFVATHNFSQGLMMWMSTTEMRTGFGIVRILTFNDVPKEDGE